MKDRFVNIFSGEKVTVVKDDGRRVSYVRDNPINIFLLTSESYSVKDFIKPKYVFEQTYEKWQ